MRTCDDRWGWALSIAGVVLLVALGQASLLLVLAPAALVLACGLVWVGARGHRVTHGLK